MNRKYWIAAGLAIAGWTGGAVAETVADPVIGAERAFAARHQEVSVKEAFLEFSAADGVALSPDGARNVKDDLATWPDHDNKGFIAWWPTLAGIAQSGDLGFTTGPASYGGGRAYSDYFTIWKKQPDGSWKWLIDLGTGQGRAAAEPTLDVTTVPVSSVAAMKADQAWKQLQKAEDRLIKEGASKAYAPEVRLLGYRPDPVDGFDQANAILAARSSDFTMERSGGGVSSAGDLGYTYGFARWTDAGAAKRGPYLRVWQRRSDGWKVLAENVTPF